MQGSLLEIIIPCGAERLQSFACFYPKFQYLFTCKADIFLQGIVDGVDFDPASGFFSKCLRRMISIERSINSGRYSSSGMIWILPINFPFSSNW